ncbi:MAG: hypothetical protein JNL58_24065 [Planctomyces sp.]|nr:hypothetical protein [Planctomyces sp.]
MKSTETIDELKGFQKLPTMTTVRKIPGPGELSEHQLERQEMRDNSSTFKRIPHGKWRGLKNGRFMMICVFLILTSGDTAISDEGWGSIKGKISFEGSPPPVTPIEITRDEEVCGKFGLVDESLVVHPDSRGIRYIAIWIESRDKIPVHPDLQATSKKLAEIDNKDCRFEPHMLTLRTKEPLLLKNSDPVAHNAAIYARRNTPSSEVIAANQPSKKSFPKAELMPVRVDCSIHSWMKAWILILDHPYAAITNEHGEFSIKQIPPGKWKFRFWHERPQWIKQLKASGVATPLEKGAWEITITADEELDLGELTMSPEQFSGSK